MARRKIHSQVRYARVPMGGETCPFCLMLASRGAVYTSSEAAGEMNHYHANCHCKVVPSWGLSEVEGYDPAELYKEWREWREGIESVIEMRPVSIEIDEWTPCLRRTSDNAILQTSFRELKNPPKVSGWEFDWSVPFKKGETVKALYVEGDKRVQGLIAFKVSPENGSVFVDIVESAPHNRTYNNPKIAQKEYVGVGPHLFAEAVRISYEAGFDGYVDFFAKTNLVDYYCERLGAKILYGRHLVIDERAAAKLFEEYYGTKD